MRPCRTSRQGSTGTWPFFVCSHQLMLYAICKIRPSFNLVGAQERQHGGTKTHPPLTSRWKLSVAITCPHVNINGGLASVACSFDTGQTKTEWNRRSDGRGISIYTLAIGFGSHNGPPPRQCISLKWV